MKTILITGGAGFIGSHLCKELAKNKDNYIICIDNLYTGSLKNIIDLLGNDNFNFIYGDITNQKLFEDLGSINEIYNCACPASPVHYQNKHSIDTTLTCVLGTYNLLELARKNDAKIMQFSTSEVYGEPNCKEQKEDYRGNVNCIGIRSCYDEGKRCAESLCFDYNRNYKTKIKVIRIFNTYGPNMNKDDGRVVSNFINQALNDKQLTIYGDGSQTRSFCYVSDLIRGILTVMSTDDCFIGPVNLGNPNEISMNKLKTEIETILNKKVNTIFNDLPQDDPTHRKPDISLAKSLGWEPKVSLKEGLEKTINYFRSL